MGAKLNRGGSRQDYQTPIDFIDAVEARLHTQFWRDLAATNDNHIPDIYEWFTPEQNSLVQEWSVKDDGWNWLNPPFSDIRPWAQKCWEESSDGSRVAMLVPASIGSNWWQEFVHHKAHVLMLNDRIQFVGADWVYPKDLGLLLYTPFIRQGSYEGWSWKS